MRQRQQSFRIGEHQLRRIKRANEIFSFRKIYAGFAADRAVHLRHQRGGHMHQTHTAQIAGGREASHVAHDSAAHRDNCGVAIGAGPHQLPRDLFDGGEVFRRFAVVEEHGAHGPPFVFAERAQQRAAPVLPHARRGKHVDAGGLAQPRHGRASASEYTRRTLHVVIAAG